jgi:WD40 repeat protein
MGHRHRTTHFHTVGSKHGLDIVVLSPDGRFSAGDSFESNAINVWDATTGKLIAAVTDPEGHGATALTFNTGDTELAVTDTNANVNVWKISQLRECRAADPRN